MCTFSYLIKKEEIIFTSNRDEIPERSAGLDIQHITTNEGWYLFPLDKMRGGTWIGINSKKEVYCLLNGAEHNHVPRLYPISRGSVIAELLMGRNILQNENFIGMAPFTLVSFQKDLLAKYTFDEKQKLDAHKVNQESGIFSSSTLYNSTEKENHRSLFSALMLEPMDENKLFDFHQRADIRYESQSLERKSAFIRTVTTTQFIIRGKTIRIRIRDHASQQENEYILDI